MKRAAYPTPPRHDPSPEEIRAACLAMQETWSDDERIRRAGRNAHWGDSVEARQVRCEVQTGESDG